MTDALRSEWIKFRTVRGNIVLIICAIGAPLLLSLLIALFADFENNSSQDAFEAIVLVPPFLPMLKEVGETVYVQFGVGAGGVGAGGGGGGGGGSGLPCCATVTLLPAIVTIAYR